jgi:hypothetical protein
MGNEQKGQENMILELEELEVLKSDLYNFCVWNLNRFFFIFKVFYYFDE